MRTSFKTILLAPALAMAAACSNDKPADPALNNDLSLAAQANQNARMDSISAAERTNAAAAPANVMRSGSSPSATTTRRTSSSTSTRRSTSSGTASGTSSSGTATASEPRVVTKKNTKRDAAIGAAAGGILGGVIGNNVDVQKEKAP